jgi:hypothetical protein
MRSKQSSEQVVIGAAVGTTSPTPGCALFSLLPDICGAASMSLKNGASKVILVQPKCVFMRAKRGRHGACAPVAAARPPLHLAGLAQGHGPSCSCMLRGEATDIYAIELRSGASAPLKSFCLIFDLDHPFMLLYRTPSSPSSSRLFHSPTSPLGCVLITSGGVTTGASASDSLPASSLLRPRPSTSDF